MAAPNPNVTEIATIGSPHGPDAAVGDVPLEHVPIQANLTQEYVSGQPSIMLQSFLRSLPFYIDELSAAFGDDIWDRMALDPTVASSSLVLILGALGQGLQLTPAAKAGDAQFELAAELAAFVQANLNGMSSQPHRWLVQLAEGIKCGNKIAEKTYRESEPGELDQFPELTKRTLGTALLLGAMKVKPRHSYAFVVDIYQNLVGLVGLQPGKGIAVLAQTLITPSMVKENLLPREKFCVFTHLPMDEDPRGRSCIRPAYNPWFAKQQCYGEYLKYLAQFGTPGVVGETPPGSVAQPLRNQDGSYVIGPDGRPVTVDPEARLVKILENYRGGACIGVPAGTNVKSFEARGDGSVFLKAFQYFDNEVSKAILGQTLATGEGVHDSRAAASVHQDILGLFVSHLKREIEAMVQDDVIRELIRINYGEDLLPLAPRASLGDVTPQDLAALMASVAQLQSSGYLEDSQKPELDARMGLPVRILVDTADAGDGTGEPDADDAGGNGQGGSGGKSTPGKPEKSAAEYAGFARLERELASLKWAEKRAA